eukprot:Gb_11516 [translate_table: standard]
MKDEDMAREEHINEIKQKASFYQRKAATLVKYSREPDNSTKSCKARGYDLCVHFKNIKEIAQAIKKLTLAKAKRHLKMYLLTNKPYHFVAFVNRTAQAKSRHDQGHWPAKSTKFLLGLLKNEESNAEVKALDMDTLYNFYIQESGTEAAEIYISCAWKK